MCGPALSESLNGRAIRQHAKKGHQLVTLNGLGTRIDLVAYIARRPNASPSNIDGPIFLQNDKRSCLTRSMYKISEDTYKDPGLVQKCSM